MITSASAEHCLSFIHTQLQAPGKPGDIVKKEAHRAVTISRQTGCGAAVVAGKLADYLQEHASGDGQPWTVFDRNLMDKVLDLVALNQRASAIAAERVTESAARSAGQGTGNDDPSEMQPVFGVGQKAAKQKRGLRGNRNACVFDQKGESNRPVSIVGDELAKMMERMHDGGKSSRRGLSQDAFSFALPGQKINQHPAEFLWTFLVGKMAHVFEGD